MFYLVINIYDIILGTEVKAVANDPEVPLLTVDLADLSEEHLRPDFIDEMFLAPSDSDEDEDLDHLCEYGRLTPIRTLLLLYLNGQWSL